MKYLKKWRLFENHDDIHDICKEYGIKNYTINGDGTIDGDGEKMINLSHKGLIKIPLDFNKVGGSFYCNNNNLTSLEGAPESVGGNFDFSYNKLTSLEGAPQEVGGYFDCDNNQLTSLEGAPQSVSGDFYCYNNKLTNLNGLEFKSFGRIYLENNPIYTIVKDWINNDNREDLIEYFVDMDIIQDNKLIMMRLEAFYEDMDLEMNIDFNKVKKYYEILE